MKHFGQRQRSRRRFLATSAAAAGYFSSRAAAEPRSPSEKLRIACVGTINQAAYNIGELASESIVAVCDVDAANLEGARKRHPKAASYRDFRSMLDRESSRIDAVLVATPDHIHAPAAAMALSLGKHVYCEKPLAHTVREVRHLTRLAKEKKLATQMGTQIHAGENYRRCVEIVQSGVIGTVSEVHVWVSSTQWCDGRFTPTAVPRSLDWDLYLGPSAPRPFSANIHPRNWRSFWDFGGGMLSDLGCHRIDLVHWALGLEAPTAVSAEGSPHNPVGTPRWTVAHWEYLARGAQPPVTMTWYHGKRPPILDQYRKADGKPFAFGDGVLFVGKEGTLYGDYDRRQLFPIEKFRDVTVPKTIPPSVGHHREWIQAAKTGSPTTCAFAYSGPLTESVLLGIVAYRLGRRIEWDAGSCRAKDCPEAERFLTKEYRKGWEIPGLA